MDVVTSTHVQRWHIEGAPPVLIELELADEATGRSRGFACALLSPALAEELGVRLQMLAASDFDVPASVDDLVAERLLAHPYPAAPVGT